LNDSAYIQLKAVNFLRYFLHQRLTRRDARAALGMMSTIVWRYPAHKTRAVFDQYDIIDEEDQRRISKDSRNTETRSWQSREKSFPYARLDNEFGQFTGQNARQSQEQALDFSRTDS
jgi:hypothetical protein